MKKIDLETYPRRALFEAFKDREVPVFSVTNLIEISAFKPFIDQNGYGFFVAISFLISKAVNQVPELRHRLICGELFEFEKVDPGYTVLLDDRTFSFCDSKYFEDFEAYRKYAEKRIDAVKKRPDLETWDKHGMFFITNLPWFSFTSITHPFGEQYASIPIISIGKYFEQNGSLIVPIGIQVHHGLVDGIHIGDFYENLSAMLRTPADYYR
jgi:chloramphenicol O-acetyltransferase type A